MAAISSLLTLASTLSLASCLPFSQNHSPRELLVRQQINCNDSRAIPSATCWATLDVGNYLTGWNKSTPTCGPNDDGAGCCVETEPWANCFLRLGTGSAGYDCSRLGDSSSCSAHLLYADPNLAPSIKSQVSYVLRTISNVYNGFSTMSKIIAMQPVDNKHVNDILKLNSDSQNFNQTERTLALSLGPAFLGNLSESESPAAFDSAVYALSNITADGLRAAPAVAEAMWSQIGAGDSILAIYQRGLTRLMSDLPSFVEFCASGWSGYLDLSFANPLGEEYALVSSAFVYETSTILQQQGWYAVPGSVSDISSSLGQSGCSALSTSGVVCTDSHGSTTFQSAVTGRSYTFAYQGKGSSPLTPANLLQELNTHLGEALFFNGNAELAPVFFDGAYNCTLEGAAGALKPIRPDGSIDLSCLSVLPMYLHKGSACPDDAVLFGGKCPFGFEG